MLPHQAELSRIANLNEALLKAAAAEESQVEEGDDAGAGAGAGAGARARDATTGECTSPAAAPLGHSKARRNSSPSVASTRRLSRGKAPQARVHSTGSAGPFEWTHEQWPFTGMCACSPLRTWVLREHFEQALSGKTSEDMERGSSVATDLVLASKVLGVHPCWLSLQRGLRMVTLQLSLLWLYFITLFFGVIIMVLTRLACQPRLACSLCATLLEVVQLTHVCVCVCSWGCTDVES